MKRIGFTVCMIILLSIVLSLMPLESDAKSGSLVVPAGSGKSVNLGTLHSGYSVEYSWYTDDPGDKVTFYITDESQSYERVYSTYRSFGTFEVPAYGSYRMYWYNDNYWMDADISYSYDVEQPVHNSDPGSDQNITSAPPDTVSDVDEDQFIDMIRDRAVAIILILTGILFLLISYSIYAILRWKRENDEIERKLDDNEAVLEKDILPPNQVEEYPDRMVIEEDDEESIELEEERRRRRNRLMKRKLRDLKEMHDEELISDEEYRIMKRKILKKFR
ncbi:MAG: SHOCT domain-containing protein [Thermoplasmatota archaeon]